MILAVDDQASVLEAISDILELIGQEALLAEDGTTANDLFSNNQDVVKLVLLDLTLPDIPGEKLLTQFKQASPDTPVLIMTGYSTASLVQRADLQQADGFLEKPFRLNELIETIQTYLDK